MVEFPQFLLRDGAPEEADVAASWYVCRCFDTPRGLLHSRCYPPYMYDAKGAGFGDPGVGYFPASAASRYFGAPQANILRILRPRWPISWQNGAPTLSTGKTKVGLLLELITTVSSNSALLNGKVV